MDLKLSYSWLKEYVSARQKPEELAKLLSLHSFNVERIHKEGANLDKVVVGQIIKLSKHPNAEKLSLTMVNVGGGEVPGGGKQLKIICGAKNIYENMFCAVALPGAHIRWHGEGELVELKPATIRGEESFGMICAAEEIGLGDLFSDMTEGVMDLKFLDADGIDLGTPLAQALRLDDYIYEMEITSNRPDAMGVIGLAREAAAVSGGKFLYKPAVPPKSKSTETLPLTIELNEKKACTKYTALVLSDIEIKSSPWWLQKRLRQIGTRPINNIVDITNYIMMEHGKPMHAFDYDKLAGHKITIRHAKQGEKLKALDGKIYDFKKPHLIMADENGPVEIAGLMGGEASGISSTTTKIVLLSACFDHCNSVVPPAN